MLGDWLISLLNLISRLIVPTTVCGMFGDWPISTLVWRSGDCTEYVKIPNHGRGLVDHALWHAQGLCWLPTVLEDSSITPYAMLETCFDYSPTTTWGLIFLVTYELDWIILIFRPCYKAHTSPSSKLGDYIGTMHLAMHFSIRFSMWFFLFRPWHHVPMSPTTRLGD